MKRLIGLYGFAAVFAFSCAVLESRAANTKIVSDYPVFTIENYHGFDFDYSPVVLTATPVMILDNYFTYVVEGVTPKSNYKSIERPRCRSPGGLPNRF